MRVPGIRTAVVTFALVGAMFLVACGGDSDDDTPEPTQTAEPTATADPGNGNGGGGGDGDATVTGLPVAEYYGNNCSACHGANREGVSGLGLPLLPERLTESDEFYADTIANGRAGTVMPAWADSGLTPEEIDTLVAFIRTEA